jgi:hypothetical protein
MSTNLPNQPAQNPEEQVAATGTPGNVGGPDTHGGGDVPLKAPEREGAEEYHPERGNIASTGGLGGGDAAGATTHRTTAGEPVRGYSGPTPPPNWAGGPPDAYIATPAAAEGKAGGPQRTPQPSESRRLAQAERGSAAPDYDSQTTSGVDLAGEHTWPLPTSGAPTVTGTDTLSTIR